MKTTKYGHTAADLREFARMAREQAEWDRQNIGTCRATEGHSVHEHAACYARGAEEQTALADRLEREAAELEAAR